MRTEEKKRIRIGSLKNCKRKDNTMAAHAKEGNTVKKGKKRKEKAKIYPIASQYAV